MRQSTDPLGRPLTTLLPLIYSGVVHNQGGALGWGMAASVGVSLAHNKAPVLCVLGTVPRSTRLKRSGAPVGFVILNNAEYGILMEFMLNRPQYNAQKKHGFLAMDIRDPQLNFQFLARSMGVSAQKVTSKAEISGMVEVALASGKSQVIEIPVTNTRSIRG